MRVFAMLVLLASNSFLAFAQQGVSGKWQTILPSGETVTVELVANNNPVDGTVEFENGRVEEITEGTIAPASVGWRIRFVSTGLLNGDAVFLLWEGETATGRADEITMSTTIQLVNGREIELYSPRSYTRLPD